MDKNKLTLEDAQVVDQNEKSLDPIFKQLEMVRNFKVGDYLIAYRRYAHTGQRVLVVNSYGTPKKYKVAYIDKNQIPYVKLLTNSGKPSGTLRPLLSASEEYWEGRDEDWEFELDPEYVEAIIVQSEEQYIPSFKHEKNAKIRSEIVEFNKSIKLNTRDAVSLIGLFDRMQVGETYWFSTKNGMSILETTLINVPKEFVEVKKITKRVTKIKVRLSNGKEEEYCPWDLAYRNIYKGQPRSFNELKDPI